MQVAYLILAHHQPLQLFRLVKALSAEGNYFYIHLDARADLREFEFIQEQFEKVVFIKQREACFWGQFSLVQATLNLIKATGEKYDYSILLSAQDYPIKNNSEINQFLHDNMGKSFINYKMLPCKEVNERQNGAYRFNRLHVFDGLSSHKVFPPYSKKKLFNGLFNAWANWYGKRKRPVPNNMTVYWGHQWWILHNDAIKDINKIVSDEKIIDFFKNTWIADEMFFQTILLNSTDSIKRNLVDNNYKFTHWEIDGDRTFHPSVLNEKHFSELRDSDCLFARKFSDEESIELIDKIDQQLLSLPVEL